MYFFSLSYFSLLACSYFFLAIVTLLNYCSSIFRPTMAHLTTLLLPLLVTCLADHARASCQTSTNIDITALDNTMSSYRTLLDRLTTLTTDMKDVAKHPIPTALLAYSPTFEHIFNALLLPKSFLLSEKLGMFVKLDGPASVDIDAFIRQCDYLEGEVFELSRFDIPDLKTMMLPSFHSIRVPWVHNNTLTSKIASSITGREVPWAKHSGIRNLLTVSTDSAVGVVFTFDTNGDTYSWTTTKAEVEKVDVALCSLPTTMADKMQSYWADSITHFSPSPKKITTIDAKLSTLRSSMASNSKCPGFSVGLPPFIRASHDSLESYFDSLGDATFIPSLSAVHAIERMAANLTDALTLFSDTLDKLQNFVDQDGALVSLNRGDWGDISFDITEGEEQIILSLGGGLVLVLVSFSILLIYCYKTRRRLNLRLRTHLRYPDPNDMPLVERARLNIL